MFDSLIQNRDNDEAKLALLYGTLDPEKYINNFIDQNGVDVEHIEKVLEEYKNCGIVKDYSMGIKTNSRGIIELQIDIEREKRSLILYEG